MSVFYCVAHARLEDSDYVEYYVTGAGEEFCGEAYAEVMEREDVGYDYDAYMAQYDNDPSVYDGTYSED